MIQTLICTCNVTEGTMPTDDKMNIDERFKYLRIMHQRYAVGRLPPSEPFLTIVLAPAIVVVSEGEGALVRALFCTSLAGEHDPFDVLWHSPMVPAGQVEAARHVEWAAGITGAVTRVGDSKESTSFSSRDSWLLCY
jgi:hypothetical protein